MPGDGLSKAAKQYEALPLLQNSDHERRRASVVTVSTCLRLGYTSDDTLLMLEALGLRDYDRAEWTRAR